MSLQNELDRQGNWLFRWRSYLPLAILPFLVLAVFGMHWPFGSLYLHEILEVIFLGVSFVGLAIRIHAVGHAPANTSGRNTQGQVADTLNTTGLYSIVRHPLYVGNYFIGLGVFAVPAVWWLPAIYTLVFWLYYERIMFAEEKFLKNRFGETFSDWAAVTPAFVPNFKLWQRAELPFSLANICKREYTALGLIVLLHTSIEASEHLVIEHRIPLEPFWIALLAFGAVTYLALRTVKKRTKLLDVVGR